MESEKKKNIHFNPLDITESLGYTTFRKDSRKPWTREEDLRLSELIDIRLRELGLESGVQSLAGSQWASQSSQLAQELNWDEISEKLETRKAKDCRKRWTNSLDPNLKKGKWTHEEDDLLVASFKRHGSSWQKISAEIPGRTDDQCAKRYIEVLDPNTKDRLRTWTIEEDLSLIKKVKAYGTKWRTISLEMESRPSLTCRNRWRKIVTDVVRGKANALVKKEIDSIEGGLSKLEEINELLHNQKNEAKSAKLDKNSKIKNETLSNLQKIPQTSNHLNGIHRDLHHRSQLLEDTNQSQMSSISPPGRTSSGQSSNLGHYQHMQASLTGVGSPSYAGSSSITAANSLNNSTSNIVDSPKPLSTEMDWKYTLKDTSGLTLSNGNISSSDLAKNLIDNAKKYNLKISIHQHIHHHYAQTSTSKLGSPEDSSSNVSGNNNLNEELVQPNRYSHFNYLSPMVPPQLESSNLIDSRENELAKVMNASLTNHHQYQSVSSKRRLSSSSNNSRKKHLSQQFQTNLTHHQNNPFDNHEELEDELDFWETMRSLSQVVNNETDQLKKNKKLRRRVSESLSNQNSDLGLYYGGNGGGTFGEDDDLDFEELEDNLRDIGGFAGLPFNPS